MQSSSSNSYPTQRYPSADQVNYDYFTMQHFNQLASQSVEQMSVQQNNYHPHTHHNMMNIYESVNDGAGHVNYASFNQLMSQSINQLSSQSLNQSARPRKSRHIKTTHAMRTLKQLFVENCKPSKDAMRSMTQSTGCTYAEVARWFRNERHKAKKAKINYQSIKQSNKSNQTSRQTIAQRIDHSSTDHSATSSTPSSPSSSRTTSPGQAPVQGQQAFFPSIHHHPVEVAQWMSTFHNFDFENLDKM